MPRLIAFDWEADSLAGIEADVSGETVHVRRCFRYEWPAPSDPPQSAAALGQWLADALKRDGITPGEARVVLPREAVVVRTLDLPRVPENELPDLVRFQAATKSSTPLDRLALDFLPLPVDEADSTLQVLMITVEDARLKRIRETLSAAGIELTSVGISPVAVGELVRRLRGEQPSAPDRATLFVFQDAHRVEISTLVEQRVIFSHHSRLSGADDADGLRTATAEVNRAVIALSQAQSDLEIAEVCLIHTGDAGSPLEKSLAQRFGERLHVLDVTKTRGVRLGRPADAAGLASFAPALGALVAAGDPHLAAIDFLAPRRAIVKPDRTKLRIGLGAAAAVLVGGIAYWMVASQIADLTAQREVIEQSVRDIDTALKQGQPDLEAAGILAEWTGASRDPLTVLDRLNRLTPGTDRVYLQELSMSIGGRDQTFNIEGVGAAVEEADVRQLQEILESDGLRVEPIVGRRSSDPDYPRGFDLKVELPANVVPTTGLN